MGRYYMPLKKNALKKKSSEGFIAGYVYQLLAHIFSRARQLPGGVVTSEHLSGALGRCLKNRGFEAPSICFECERSALLVSSLFKGFPLKVHQVLWRGKIVSVVFSTFGP